MQIDLLFNRGNKLSEALLNHYNKSFGYKAHLYVVVQQKQDRSNDLAKVFGETTSQYHMSEFTEKKDVYLLLGRNDFVAMNNRSDLSVQIFSSYPILKGSKIEIRIQSDDIVYQVTEEPQIGPHQMYSCQLSPFMSTRQEGSHV